MASIASQKGEAFVSLTWPKGHENFGQRAGRVGFMRPSMILLLLLLSAIWVACSSPGRPTKAVLWAKERMLYRLQDGSGESFWRRESGQDVGGRYLVNKSIIYNMKLGPQRPLEKEVIFSELGQLDHQVLLRPWRTQYRVWLEGKEHFSEMQLDLAQRKMKIKLRSPEARWNGVQEISFPPGKVFCFYGQLAECLRVHGFLQRAQQKGSGQLNFTLIWEGYPYQQEQYPPLAGLFTPAVAEYDGEYGEGLTRFSISFGEQVFFLIVDSQGRLQNLFWVAQGLSVEPLKGRPSTAPEAVPTSTPLPAVTATSTVKPRRWAADHPDGTLGQLDDGIRSR